MYEGVGLVKQFISMALWLYIVALVLVVPWQGMAGFRVVTAFAVMSLGVLLVVFILGSFFDWAGWI